MDKAYLSTPEAHAKLVQSLGLNVENLILLRDFLRANFKTVQKHFAMEEYFSGFRGSSADEVQDVMEHGADCGSNMCVVGWSPAVPELREVMSKLSNWHDVTQQFICTSGRTQYDLFGYLFGAEWEDDLALAIERLDNIIEAGSHSGIGDVYTLVAAATCTVLDPEDRDEDVLEAREIMGDCADLPELTDSQLVCLYERIVDTEVTA